MATHGLFEKAAFDRKAEADGQGVSIAVRDIYDPNGSSDTIDDADKALEAMGCKPVSPGCSQAGFFSSLPPHRF